MAWNFTRLWRARGPIGPIGPEDGPRVLVIPGFLATDKTTLILRKALARAGWRVYGWGQGFNGGAQEDTLRLLRERLDSISSEEPVLLVGWSLGGLYARELAREIPDRVRAVVTLGAPVAGDMRQNNNMWRIYEMVAKHKVDEPPLPHFGHKPPVPTLAIWSSTDGIVAVRAARGVDGERDKAAEVRSAHMAFGVSTRATEQIVREIGDFLEEIEGSEW
jgi:pimeloyl-ACP methyl ester carboxylesterase